MLEKYFEGKIPTGINFSRCLESSGELGAYYDLWNLMDAAMNKYDPRHALELIWIGVQDTNILIEVEKPWILAKDPNKKTKLAETMVILGERLAHFAYLLRPFLPETSKKILNRLHLQTDLIIRRAEDFARPFLQQGISVEKGEALFPRLEEPPHPNPFPSGERGG